MELHRKLTGALAWAGLVIVITVPAAEAIMSRLMPEEASALPVTAPASAPQADAAAETPAVTVKPAAVTQVAARPAPAAAEPIEKVAATAPARTAAAAAPAPEATAPAETTTVASGDNSALDAYLATGKQLPDYIKPRHDTPAPAATDAPLEAATATTPAGPQADDAAPAAQVASLPEPDQAAPVAPVAAPVPMPASARPTPPPQRVVTEADLKDWKSGSLEDFLRQQGLLSDGRESVNSPAQ
jgi:hypothetical protein